VETFTSARLVVTSPGVPWELAELQAARGAGVPVMAEIELASRELKGRVAAVTGTKGKSTTTAALGAMLREAGGDVRVGGNIGEALIGLVESSTDDTVFCVEVSSFQLEGTQQFHPHVAVFLNLSADHLDRHPTFDAYAAAKARIFANQTEVDWAVVNADDPEVLARARAGRARVVPFRGEGAPLTEGASFDGGLAVLRREGSAETLFALAEAKVPGRHLAADLLAAATAARLLGAPVDAIRRAVVSFHGVEHVLEPVGEIRGVRFFNDSKATNVEAARRSLESFPGPLLVILGGRYKGGDFGELRELVQERVKAVLAIGEAQERIVSALGTATRVVRCASMREAVEQAFAAAAAGDTVLLAPACSSFDMFRDYAERGRVFKAEVERLSAMARGESEGAMGLPPHPFPSPRSGERG
jgi:UDP-N-acetylmuramoylalanine--D-glutamate ligase